MFVYVFCNQGCASAADPASDLSVRPLRFYVLE